MKIKYNNYNLLFKFKSSIKNFNKLQIHYFFLLLYHIKGILIITKISLSNIFEEDKRSYISY